MEIGKQLKASRKQKGLSQRKLARISGVNNGTISLIEQDKISPSVALLKRLLDAMSISLGEFFDGEGASPTKHFFRAGELPEHTSGDVTFQQIGSNYPGHVLQILRERYHSRGDTGELMLVHQGEEGGMVLKGSIEITLGQEVAVLSPGDSYYFDSSVPHRFRNLNDEECEIISVCTPPTF